MKPVIFPANQNSIVTAVTRLDPDGTVGCEASSGTAVDFAAYGNQPATGPFDSISGMSGSSNAVAVIAGIAALTWSRFLSYTRSQVLGNLIVAASPTGALSNTIGWGAPNALCSVGAMCTAWVEGPSLVEQTGTHTFTAVQRSGSGPITYLWNTGATTPTIQRSYTVTSNTVDYIDVVTVTITTVSDGRQKTVSKSVYVRNPFPGCPTCF